ncbi:MAG: hypothetical protein M1836_005454 [Candelina mexicana]|nr:MAG: hypothetical protein M1836_005454 [Candelina mexicana]
MRLQLIVQRHGLPPTHVLWNVTSSGDTQTTGRGITISQFLEQVNEIIPLESDDWGLEDYSVEVAGFECLHFSDLGSVLRDEDEVTIRPLQTSDLRVRRLTGRHQISSDGKHLIDGVAFGRPYLRRTDRPSIRIPPRKRRRLTYDEDENEIENAEVDGDRPERQLVVKAGFEDVDEGTERMDGDINEGARRLLDAAMLDFDSGDDMDDTDFDPSEVRGGPGGLRGEEKPARTQGPSRRRNAAERERYVTRSRTRGTGIILEDGHILELVDENGEPYPGEYDNALLDYFEQSEDDLAQRLPAAEAMNTSTEPGRSSRKSRLTSSRLLSQSVLPQLKSQPPSAKTVRFGNVDNEDHKEVAGFVNDEEDDEDFQPGNALNDDETDEMSSEGSSDSEDATETLSSLSAPPSSSESSFISPSSSEEESAGSAPQEVPSQPQAKQKRRGSRAKEIPTKVGITPKADLLQHEKRPIQSSPPGEGLQATRKRNQRRRDKKKLTYLKKIGELDLEATIRDLEEYRAKDDTVITPEPSQGQLDEQTQIAKKLGDFQTKREELLASLASGGVNIGDSGLGIGIKKAHEPDVASAKGSANNSRQDMGEDMQNIAPSALLKPTAFETPAGASKISDTPMTMPTTAIIEAASEQSRRRNKLDIASSRRLLFGSLGVRTPKTKDDEQKLRDDFMKHARIPSIRKLSPAHIRFDDAGVAVAAAGTVSDLDGDQNPNGQKGSGEAAKEAGESWKAKINLSAVECCREGIKLSTPPFPFVQRWDPQQQGDALSGRARKKKGKAKKRKRDEAKFYEGDEPYLDGQNAIHVDYAEPEADVDLNYDEPMESLRSENGKHQDIDEVNAAINEQFMRDAEGLSASAAQPNGEEEDLIAIPNNLSSYPLVAESEIQTGCIIAFKQLDMSEGTNWQPRISDYRTARVESFLDDGTLQMMLAKRDRRDRELIYDEKTGDRIYGKFEMPGYDGDDAPEDDGFIEVAFGELIEPKLLQVAEQPSGDQFKNVSNKYFTADGVVEGVEVTASSNIADLSELSNVVTDVTSPVTEQSERPVSVSDSARLEITKLIKDAGFRSSLGSVVDQSIDQPAAIKEADQKLSDDPYVEDNRSGLSTPRFNGFGSSPPPSGPSIQESSPQHTTTSIPKTQFTGDTRRKPTFGRKASQQAEDPTKLYPELPIMSSQRSAGNIEADVSVDDGFRFGSDVNHSEVASENSEGLIENTQPYDDTAGSPLWTSSPFQPGPSTKILGCNIDSDKSDTHLNQAFQALGFESSEIEDDVLLTTFEIKSSENPSNTVHLKDALCTIAKSRQSSTLLTYLQHLANQFTSSHNHEPSSPTINELPSVEEPSGIRSLAPSSDNEFPSLESVISTARSSFESVKDERRSAQPQSQAEMRKQLDAVPEYRPASNDSPFSPDEDGQGETTPKASQQPVQTQASYVIDLTQSSDPVSGAVEEDDDDDGDGSMGNGSSLPRGPGWVRKRKGGGSVGANKRVKRVGRRGGSV